MQYTSFTWILGVEKEGSDFPVIPEVENNIPYFEYYILKQPFWKRHIISVSVCYKHNIRISYGKQYPAVSASKKFLIFIKQSLKISNNFRKLIDIINNVTPK